MLEPLARIGDLLPPPEVGVLLSFSHWNSLLDAVLPAVVDGGGAQEAGAPPRGGSDMSM